MLRVGTLMILGKHEPHSLGMPVFTAQFGKAGGGGQGCSCPPLRGSSARITFAGADRRERLEGENELLGFPASGHPLELHSNIGGILLPSIGLGEHIGEEVVTCGWWWNNAPITKSLRADEVLTLAD